MCVFFYGIYYDTCFMYRRYLEDIYYGRFNFKWDYLDFLFVLVY